MGGAACTAGKALAHRLGSETEITGMAYTPKMKCSAVVKFENY